MKITKILICTTSLLAIYSTDALAVQRVENQKVYKEDFDPYQHPQSLTDFLHRQQAAPAPEPIPQYQPQAMQNVAPRADEIYSEPSLQSRRPVNVQGTSMMAMQQRYMPAPVMTPEMAMAPQPMPLVSGPAYRGDLATEEESEELDSNLYTPGVTITPKVGTQGIGLEVGTAFNKYIGARVGGNYLKYSDSQDVNNKNYDYDIDIANGEALVDVHPFANGFRLTGGAYYNPDKVKLTYTPTASEIIGDNTYTAGQIGTVRADIETSDFSPYAGIGFSRAFTKAGNWFFDTDLGVKFNDVSSTITSDGTLASNSTFNDDLLKEKQKIQDEFELLDYYPVINIGFGYKF